MRYAALAFPALVLASCGHAGTSTAEGSAISSRSFALSDFDQVALRGSDDVSVIVGKDFSVSATGPQSSLDQLEVIVEDGALKIGRKSGSSWHIGWSRKSDKSVKVTVTMPVIRGAKLSGSGDMTVDRAAADAFLASLAGSGNLNIGNVQAKTVNLRLAGSGDLMIGGRTKQVDISSAGSGDITAKALEADIANISLAGSGNASVRATGNASVSLMGSGDVQITGTSQCKTSKLGSGSVTCTI
jgi:hypothetical protein